MSKFSSRRRFLKSSLVGGVGGVVALPLLARAAGAAPAAGPDVCVTLCNHWSYIGIGWQLGIESCVLAVTDAMEMVDREPHVKTNLEMDARCYEFMAEKFPEVATRLAKYLAAGKLELIGGSYSQPMGTTVGGESNIRQIVVGRETIRKALGYEVATMLHEEEFTHPQLPQLSALSGCKYASLAQVDTWGRAGCPRLDYNAIFWKGIDGTTILTVPKNALFGFSPDVNQLVASAEFKKLKKLGRPLVFCWEEFGWESPEEPAYLSAPGKYLGLAKEGRIEFVTLRQYLDEYGAEAKETILLPMDAWNKSCTWGLGGDQVRIMQRKMEGLLLAAEVFDAAASSLGAKSQAALIDKAWKDMLTSQSHDVGLCEYSRWQGDRFAPAERLEDRHNFPWGEIGYNFLDASQKECQQALDTTLADLGRRIGSAGDSHGPLAVTVLNPHCWPRSDVAATGRIYPLPAGAKDVVVKDRAGKAVASQIVRSSKDLTSGDLIVAEVAFQAQQVPSAGYDTYYLDFTSEAAPPVATDLKIDEAKLTLENEHLLVRLAADTGGIVSLVHKASGREMLDAAKGPFPRLTGRPNLAVAKLMHRNPPEFYDSAKSKAAIDWLAKGPVRAEVRAQHALGELRFETRISLAAGAVRRDLQPHVDPRPAQAGRASGRHQGGLLVLAGPFLPGDHAAAGLSLRSGAHEEPHLPRPDVRGPGGQGRGVAGVAPRHAVLPPRRRGRHLEPRDAGMGIVLHAGHRLADLRGIPSRPPAAYPGRGQAGVSQRGCPAGGRCLGPAPALPCRRAAARRVAHVKELPGRRPQQRPGVGLPSQAGGGAGVAGSGGRWAVRRRRNRRRRLPHAGRGNRPPRRQAGGRGPDRRPAAV